MKALYAVLVVGLLRGLGFCADPTEVTGHTEGVFREGVTINSRAIRSNTEVRGDGRNNLLFIDALNNRVGVSTGSPQQALDVNGNLALNGSASLVTVTSSLTVTGSALQSSGNTVVGNDMTDTLTLNVSSGILSSAWGVRVATDTTAGSIDLLFLDAEKRLSSGPRATSAVIDTITPRFAGQWIFSTSLNEMCFSTGTAIASFGLVRSSTTVCR